MQAFLAACIVTLSRPLVWLLVLAGVAGYGAYAFLNIPVEVLPHFDFPAVSIVTHRAGTPAASMESLIARPLEAELLGLPGAASVRSTIADGEVETDLRFDSGTRAAADLQAVNGAIDRARTQLPAGTAPFAQVMGAAIDEIADYALAIPSGVAPGEAMRAVQAAIVPALRGVPGVRRVEAFGIGPQALWVQPDLASMARYQVPVQALIAAIRHNVIRAPGGGIRLGHRHALIEISNLPDTAAALGRIPVAGPHGPIPLDALARIVRQAEPQHTAELLDGRPTIGLVVFKQQTASTVPVTRAVHAMLAQTAGQLPAGTRWVPIYDQGHLVRAVGGDMATNLVIGGALAVAVMLWILGLGSGAWLLAVSIPLSLLVAVAGLYALDRSLNLLTLGALIVALGLVADDAIIVLESIAQCWEQGDALWPGIRRGLRDIAAPDIVGTLTTIAVFAPLLFVGGLAGLFMRPFAIAMILALAASLVVSLSVVPLGLAMRGAPSRLQPLRSSVFVLRHLRRGNRRLFGVVLRFPRWSILACALLLLVSAAAMSLVSVDFLPLPNEGVLLESFTLPPGTSLLDTEAAVQSISGRIMRDPDVAHVLVRIGSAGDTGYTEPPYAGEIQIRLQRGVNPDSLDRIAAKLSRLSATAAVQASIDTPTVERVGESLSGLPQPFVIRLFGANLKRMRAIAEQMVKRLDRVSGLSDVFDNDGYPETQIVLRPRASSLLAAGLNPATFAAGTEAMMAGETVATIPRGALPMPVYLRLPNPASLSLQAVEQLPIGANGQTALGQVASVQLATTPNQFHHIDGARALEILATPTTAPGSAIAAAKHALAAIALPPGYRVSFGGLYLSLEHAALALALATLVAVLLMVALLVLRFEGRLIPGLLLMQIPFAFTGGAFALAASGLGLNGIGMLGFLTLVGVSLNHGIVLFDRARRNQANGMDAASAMQDALDARFRPILLTTLTAVLGMLPTALGWSVGAAPEQGLAVVIAAGVVWSAMLSTNLLPALWVSRKQRKAARTMADKHSKAAACGRSDQI
jgi:cobalt-zinc-cadmium resistance protein CzcA